MPYTTTTMQSSVPVRIASSLSSGSVLIKFLLCQLTITLIVLALGLFHDTSVVVEDTQRPAPFAEGVNLVTTVHRSCASSFHSTGSLYTSSNPSSALV
jgi:hypothetical protein